MAECIICREEKTSFSDEHVIPEALGGYYHIHTVCTQCNSDLGSRVDDKLVNHDLSKFLRYQLGIKGKSNRLPNPFLGMHHLEGAKDKKVQLRLGKDGIPTPYTIPNVAYTRQEDGNALVSVTVDATDEHKLDGILENISKRHQVPIEHLRKGKRDFVSIQRPTVRGELSIDIKKFKIGLLKIAYEFAVDSLPEYFTDESSQKIAKILKNAEYDSVESYVNLGSGFEHELFDSVSDYLDLDSKKHFLVLIRNSKGLFCLIHLHRAFSIGATLSRKPYSRSMMFGVNDIDGKTFRKVSLEQLMTEIYAPPELRFQCYVSNEREMKEFLTLEKDEEFGFYIDNGSHPLFSRTGDRLEYNLHQKMKQMETAVISESLENGDIVRTLPIDDEVYIKIMPSKKLVRIVTVRQEYHQVAKL